MTAGLRRGRDLPAPALLTGADGGRRRKTVWRAGPASRLAWRAPGGASRRGGRSSRFVRTPDRRRVCLRRLAEKLCIFRKSQNLAGAGEAARGPR